MAITHFKQTIWSKQIEKSLKKITSLRNHCNFQHKKESNNAKEIKILNVVAPQIRTYIPGTAITRDTTSDGSMILLLNQMKYFNFEVDDVDEAQSTPGLMEALTDEASRSLALEGDKYVASLVKADVEAQSPTVSMSSSVITVSKSNIVEAVEDGFATLYSHDVPQNATMYLELGPHVFKFYRPALTELSTNNPEIIKRGAVGKVNNAFVCIENLLPTGKSSGSQATDDVLYNILRTDKAIDYVEQIDKLEAYRPQDAFSDALKGLLVFGALITRPEQLYVMKTKI